MRLGCLCWHILCASFSKRPVVRFLLTITLTITFNNDHKRPLSLWLVAYGRFECRSKMISTIGMTQGAENVQKRTKFRFWVWSFRVNLFFRGKSSAAKFLGTRTHCCAMEAMIIENEEKMVEFVDKPCRKWTVLLLRPVEILRSSFCGIFGQIHSPVLLQITGMLDHVLRCVQPHRWCFKIKGLIRLYAYR